MIFIDYLKLFFKLSVDIVHSAFNFYYFWVHVGRRNWIKIVIYSGENYIFWPYSESLGELLYLSEDYMQ